MAKKISRYPIDPLDFEADWDHNRVDGRPQDGTQINEFINDSFREVARACWFADNTLYFFKSEEDKQAFIETRLPELVVYSQELSFSGEVRRVVIDNVTGSTTINAVTNQTEVNITFSFQLQRKDVTATSWDVLDDAADIVVYADGGSGYREIASYAGVERDDEITLNLRPSLLFGRNKIRVSVTARDEEHTSQSLVYTVNLANMYVENWDYQGDRKSYWYRPIIEGVSSANDYQLGGFRIVGELSKTLHVDIYAGRESQTPILQLTKAIGMTSYESNPYYFNRNVGLDLSSLPATGSYVAKVYLTSGEGSAEISTKDASIEYPFMYVKQADALSAQLVVLHDIQDTVYNFSTVRLCDYAVYDQGNSQSSPVRTIQQYLGTETYKSPIVYDGTVATSQLQTVEASIDIDSSSTVAGLLSASLAITLGSATTSFITSVDNSSSYPAVDGYDLLINPSLRSNGEQHPEYIINAVNGAQYTDATWVKTSFTDGIDGWIRDEDGVSCLRITAGGRVTLPATDFRLLKNGSNTIDLVLKVDNAADADEPCLTIATNASTAGFSGIKLMPERILVHSSTDNSAAKDTNRGTHLVAGELYHIMVSIEPDYRQGQNLVTGWVNGCENFQFAFEGNFNIAGDLVIGSDTADVSIYSLRHYSSPLSHSAAEQNYVATLRDRETKIREHDKIASVINTSHDVVFAKVKEAGLNYYVVEMLNGSTVPSKKNGWSHDTVGVANVEMHYGEHPEWSWRIAGVETMGQGTTSMGYWLWNIRHRIDKSNSAKTCGVSYWNEQTGTWGAETQSGTVMFDGDGHPAVKRITAKINYASSMQSHKMGATKAYDELHSRMFGGRMLNDAQKSAEQDEDPMPTVAVYQHPAFGFAKVGDDYTFIGIFTIGPDKGDKPTFGYDRTEVKDTLITMEGPDHNRRMVMFSYPWDESVKYLSDKEKLCITNGTDFVEENWEVGNCFGLATDDISDEESVDAKLVEIFKPAYDVVYENSTLIFPIGLNDNSPWAGATAAEIVANVNADLADREGTFSTTSYNGSRFKHTDMEFWVEDDYTLYHYDPATNTYVEGVNLLEEFPTLPSDLTLDEQNEWFKAQRRERFMEDAPTYWNIDELIYNFVFPIVFGATDNFGKNTYPYYMSAAGKWCWRQDDLDTIFDVDNNGAPSKNYWIEFADVDAGGGLVFGGGNSALWNLVSECYMDDYDGGTGKGILSFGKEMLTTMQTISGGANVYDGVMEYVKRTFWDKAQSYFPVSAYNSDNTTKYIDAWISGVAQIKDPLTQALGSHYEAEKRFVTMRMMYVMSLFRVGPFDDYSDETFGQIAFRPSSIPSLTVKLAAWMYPQMLVGTSSGQSTPRTEAGDTITYTTFQGGGQTFHYLKAADYITEIDGLSKLILGAMDAGKLSVKAKRLKQLIIGAEDEEDVTTNISTLALDCPSLEEIDARNAVELTGSLDLTSCGRVKDVLLENTQVSSVKLNRGSKIETLHLPSAITELKLENTHFLDDLVVASWAGITDLTMEECNAIGTLDALLSAYGATGSQLANIKLRWNGVESVEYALIRALVGIATGKTASGESRIFDADMEGQMKLDSGHYESDFEALELEDVTPTMSGYKEALSTIFGHPLRLFYVDKTYYPFADANVLSVLLTNRTGGNDGIGMSLAEMGSTTNIGVIFKQNTQIRNFDELSLFGLTSLQNQAFYNCSNLISMDIPSSISTLGQQALDGCTSLVIDDLYLPNLTSMGANPFGRDATHCKIKKITSLGHITSLPNGVPAYGPFKGLSELEEITLPEGITVIPNSGFLGCSNLRMINLDHIVRILDYAFSGCGRLSIQVNAPALAYNGLTKDSSMSGGQFYGTSITEIIDLGSITNFAEATVRTRATFCDCTHLTLAILPETLTKVNAFTFNGDSKLNTVVIYAVTVPTLENVNAFQGCPLTDGIYVPDESVDVYKAASNWSSYANKIRPISEWSGIND